MASAVADDRPLGGRSWIDSEDWTLERADYLQSGLRLKLVDTGAVPPEEHVLSVGTTPTRVGLARAIALFAPTHIAHDLATRAPEEWLSQE